MLTLASKQKNWLFLLSLILRRYPLFVVWSLSRVLLSSLFQINPSTHQGQTRLCIISYYTTLFHLFIPQFHPLLLFSFKLFVALFPPLVISFCLSFSAYYPDGSFMMCEVCWPERKPNFFSVSPPLFPPSHQCQDEWADVWYVAVMGYYTDVCATARHDETSPAGLPKPGTEGCGPDEEGSRTDKYSWPAEDGSYIVNNFMPLNLNTSNTSFNKSYYLSLACIWLWKKKKKTLGIRYFLHLEL